MTLSPFPMRDARLTHIGRPRRDAITVNLSAPEPLRSNSQATTEGTFCLIRRKFSPASR
jgi:hypothetical protein